MQHATIIATGSTHKVAKNERGWITLFMGDGTTKAFRTKDLIPAEIRTTESPSVREIFASASKAIQASSSPTGGESPKKTRKEASRTPRAPRARKPIAERRNGVVEPEYLPKYREYRRGDGKVSIDNGDRVATTLREVTLEQVYKICARELGESVEALKTRYSHLNPGMQRMNLGNKLRAFYRAGA